MDRNIENEAHKRLKTSERCKIYEKVAKTWTAAEAASAYIWVLSQNVGPIHFRNLSKICQKSVKNIFALFTVSVNQYRPVRDPPHAVITASTPPPPEGIPLNSPSLSPPTATAELTRLFAPGRGRPSALDRQHNWHCRHDLAKIALEHSMRTCCSVAGPGPPRRRPRPENNSWWCWWGRAMRRIDSAAH